MFHIPSESHRWALNADFFTPSDRAVRVIDAETGELSRLSLPSGESLRCVSFSDWLDERGERQVVGGWAARTRTRPVLPREMGLVRLSYPTGQKLEWVPECPIPASAPCWYPGIEPRVLFPALDGRLVQCAFAGEGLGRGRTATVRHVFWTKRAAPFREPAVAALVWPKGLNGYLVASLQVLEPSHDYEPTRLSWLRLSADGLRVAEAGPLATGETVADSFVDSGFPSVVSLPDGSQRITFLRRRPGHKVGELWVAPFGVDTTTGKPAIEIAQARKLADEIMGAPAALSPDGLWAYALQCHPGTDPEIRRFSLGQASR